MELMGVMNPQNFSSLKRRRLERMSNEDLRRRHEQAGLDIEAAESQKSDDSWANHRLACQIQSSLQEIADIEFCASKRGIELNRPEISALEESGVLAVADQGGASLSL